MSVEAVDVIDAGELMRSPMNRSGRAAWDERGNSIWEWQTRPGVFTRDITEVELKRLEASGLALVEHADAARGNGNNILHWRRDR